MLRLLPHFRCPETFTRHFFEMLKQYAPWFVNPLPEIPSGVDYLPKIVTEGGGSTTTTTTTWQSIGCKTIYQLLKVLDIAQVKLEAYHQSCIAFHDARARFGMSCEDKIR